MFADPLAERESVELWPAIIRLDESAAFGDAKETNLIVAVKYRIETLRTEVDIAQ